MDYKWYLKCSVHKNKLYFKWIKSKKLIDKENYLKYKKIFGKISKAAEINYYKKVFDSKTNSIKNMWSQINQLCSFKKTIINN